MQQNKYPNWNRLHFGLSFTDVAIWYGVEKRLNKRAETLGDLLKHENKFADGGDADNMADMTENNDPLKTREAMDRRAWIGVSFEERAEVDRFVAAEGMSVDGVDSHAVFDMKAKAFIAQNWASAAARNEWMDAANCMHAIAVEVEKLNKPTPQPKDLPSLIVGLRVTRIEQMNHARAVSRRFDVERHVMTARMCNHAMIRFRKEHRAALRAHCLAMGE